MRESSPEMKSAPPSHDVPRFRYLRPAEIDEVAELWQALHRHHVTLTAHLEGMIAPVDEHESWRRRRARYLDWMAWPGTLAILAERRGRKAGYAVVTVRPDTQGSWSRGDSVGVVQTLSVAPEHQGAGVGSALLEEVRRQLADQGVSDLELAALVGNADAMRFYERHGFRPLSTTLVSRAGAMAGPHD
jgi:ribosomal protein S18 acetylase RimI-like enzyme